MSAKPKIIVLSGPNAEIFEWASDGWYTMDQHGKPEADALFNKARATIREGKDVTDVIVKLEEAGFEVTSGRQ